MRRNRIDPEPDWRYKQPRKVGTRDFVWMLKSAIKERNLIRAIKVREHSDLVLKSFLKAYLDGMFKIAIDKSLAVSFTKEKLGKLHVMQVPSDNSVEWDLENGLIDCKLVLTHKYPHINITFDDKYRQKALKNRKRRGTQYLTDYART